MEPNIVIEVSQQQRDNLLDAMNVMWPSVPEKNVAPRLENWRGGDKNGLPSCDTIACFGGWSALWPGFQAQGVYSDEDGHPCFNKVYPAGCSYTFRYHAVSKVLFGFEHLFRFRGDERAQQVFGTENDGAVTDHEVVSRRLRWLLEHSVVVDEQTTGEIA